MAVVIIQTSKELKNHVPKHIDELDGLTMFTYVFSRSQIYDVDEVGKIIQIKVH